LVLLLEQRGLRGVVSGSPLMVFRATLVQNQRRATAQL